MGEDKRIVVWRDNTSRCAEVLVHLAGCLRDTDTETSPDGDLFSTQNRISSTILEYRRLLPDNATFLV